MKKTKKQKKPKCKFCEWKKHYEKIYENKNCVAVWGSPYVKGHVKVILKKQKRKKHKENLTDLTPQQANDIMKAWLVVGKAVQKILKPDIINWQINCNWTRHVHGHIYPRWKRDKDWGEPIKLPTHKQDINKTYEKWCLTKKQKEMIVRLLKRKSL